MKKIRICVLDQNYIVVKANTKRFGPHAIVYEGNTFAECFKWIMKVTGRIVDGYEGKTGRYYRDRTGLELPTEMRVLFQNGRRNNHESA